MQMTTFSQVWLYILLLWMSSSIFLNDRLICWSYFNYGQQIYCKSKRKGRGEGAFLKHNCMIVGELEMSQSDLYWMIKRETDWQSKRKWERRKDTVNTGLFSLILLQQQKVESSLMSSERQPIKKRG